MVAIYPMAHLDNEMHIPELSPSHPSLDLKCASAFSSSNRHAPLTNNSEDKLYNSIRAACVHRLGSRPPRTIHPIRANALSTSSLLIT